jgi:flagellar basal-body rod protein FlgC
VFEAIGISGMAMHVHQTWMDAISDNIANVNTVRPTSGSAFQARYVVVQGLENGGVGAGAAVSGVALGSDQGKLVYDPDNPQADAKGYVRMPDIDLGEQMTSMIMAQRGYQANVSNLDRVRSTYEAAIQMGKGI